MWRSTVVAEFVEWLRARNRHVGTLDAAGLDGLDLYSLNASVDAVLRYLEGVVKHVGRRGPAKAVVRAHNSHLGDARATELGDGGQLDLGQLVRERWGRRRSSSG